MLPSQDKISELDASVDPDSGDVWLTAESPSGFISVVKRDGVWSLDGSIPTAYELRDYFEPVSSEKAKALFFEAQEFLNAKR